jgi:hypothetical protein
MLATQKYTDADLERLNVSGSLASQYFSGEVEARITPLIRALVSNRDKTGRYFKTLRKTIMKQAI